MMFNKEPISSTNPSPQLHNLTEYYYMQSNGQFQVTADAFLVKINGLQAGSSNMKSDDDINHEAIKKLATDGIITDWSKYDKRENTPNYGTNNLNTLPDGKLDYVVFIHRRPGNNEVADPAGGPTIDDPNAVYLNTYYQVSGYHYAPKIPTGLAANMDIFEHELAHNMYARYHHLGANTISYDKFYTCNGWGMMSGQFSQYEVANAWERWWLGWLTPQEATTTGDYFLQDMATFHDAIKIAIPNSGGQCLWIENHQKDNYWDQKFQYDGSNGGYGIESGTGLAMYVTDGVLGNRAAPLASTEKSNNIRILHREGNFDQKEKLDANGLFVKGIAWGAYGNKPINVYSQLTRKDNPFAGTNKFQTNPQDGAFDGWGEHAKDNVIQADINQWNSYDLSYKQNIIPYCETLENIWVEELQNGTNQATYACTGTPTDLFQVGDEVGLSGIVPVAAYPSLLNTTNGFEPVTINGIRIQITGFNATTKTYTIHIDFESPVVDKNKRWCGNLELKPLPNGDPLRIEPNVTLNLDQSETASRTTIDPITGDFVNPTKLVLYNNSHLLLKSNAMMEITRHSLLDVKAGSTLELETGAKLIVKNTGELTLDGNVILHDGAEIIVEQGATFTYNQHTNLQLVGNTSCVYIKGKWLVGDNATFSFIGDGLIRLGLPLPTSLFGQNVYAGVNSKIDLQGTNRNDEILRIDAGTVFAPQGYNIANNQGFSHFSITNGTTYLGQAASVYIKGVDIGAATCNPTNPNLHLENATFTALDPSQPFEQIALFDQQCHKIHDIEVSYSVYGLVDLQLFLANHQKLTVTNSQFHHNQHGLCTLYGSADLKNVTLSENEIGWLAMATTEDGYFRNSSASYNNADGISYEGTQTLRVEASGLVKNENGLISYGNLTLRGQCSHFNDNVYNGIFVVDKGALDLSDLPSSAYGQCELINNPTSIKLKNAGTLRLRNGYNNLIPSNGGMAVQGTQALMPTATDASHNGWNNNNTMPAWGIDYELTSSLVQGNGNSSYLSDIYLDYVSCVFHPCPNCPPIDQLYQCIGCDHIFAEFFREDGTTELKSLWLNDAVKEGLRWMSWYESQNPSNLKAAITFERILSAELPSINAQERWLLDYAYENMRIASFGCISDKSMVATTSLSGDWEYNAVTTSHLLFLDNLINNETNLVRKQQYEEDRAAFYIALGNKTYGKQLFQNVLSNYITAPIAEMWLCWLENENALLQEDISLSTFLSNLPNCHSQSAERSAGNGKISQLKDKLSLSVYPNPATSEININFELTEVSDISIELLDITGKNCLNQQFTHLLNKGIHQLSFPITGLPAGIYLLKLNVNQQVITQKMVVN